MTKEISIPQRIKIIEDEIREIRRKTWSKKTYDKFYGKNATIKMQ